MTEVLAECTNMQLSDKAAYCGFSNIWLIKYERISIVDKSGKEHIINHKNISGIYMDRYVQK